MDKQTIQQKQYLKKNKFYLICINKNTNRIYVVIDIYRNTAKEVRSLALNNLNQTFYCFNCLEKKPKDFQNLNMQFITFLDLILLNKEIGNIEIN